VPTAESWRSGSAVARVTPSNLLLITLYSNFPPPSNTTRHHSHCSGTFLLSGHAPPIISANVRTGARMDVTVPSVANPPTVIELATLDCRRRCILSSDWFACSRKCRLVRNRALSRASESTASREHQQDNSFFTKSSGAVNRVPPGVHTTNQVRGRNRAWTWRWATVCHDRVRPTGAVSFGLSSFSFTRLGDRSEAPWRLRGRHRAASLQTAEVPRPAPSGLSGWVGICSPATLLGPHTPPSQLIGERGLGTGQSELVRSLLGL